MTARLERTSNAASILVQQCDVEYETLHQIVEKYGGTLALRRAAIAMESRCGEDFRVSVGMGELMIYEESTTSINPSGRDGIEWPPGNRNTMEPHLRPRVRSHQDPRCKDVCIVWPDIFYVISPNILLWRDIYDNHQPSIRMRK